MIRDVRSALIAAVVAAVVAAPLAWAAVTTLTLGINGSEGGAVVLNGATSGSVTIGVPAAAGTGTVFNLPNTNGTAGYFLRTDGSGNYSFAEPNKFIGSSWVTGMTLQNVKVTIGHVASASTATGASCRPDVVSGGTSTVDIYFAASGTACASGTKINTTACNANGTAATAQSMGITNAAISANTDICLAFSNDAAWTSTPGTGGIQLAITTP